MLETEAAAETRSRAGRDGRVGTAGRNPKDPCSAMCQALAGLGPRPLFSCSYHSTGCREEGGPGPRNIWQPVNLMLTQLRGAEAWRWWGGDTSCHLVSEAAPGR